MTWLVFVDDLHLQFRSTGRIRSAINRVGSQLIDDGDTFLIASSGPSRVAVGATSDRQLFARAIKNVVGNGLKRSDIDHANGSREVRYRTSIALTAATQMLADAVQAPAGPIAMLYFSNGYSLDLFANGGPLSQPAGQRPDISGVRVREQRVELAAMAASVGAKVFAISLIALDEPNLDPDHPEWRAHRAAMDASLRSIAEESGGFASVDGDLETALKLVATALGR